MAPTDLIGGARVVGEAPGVVPRGRLMLVSSRPIKPCVGVFSPDPVQRVVTQPDL
jgi:hypothetical protein